VTGRWSAIIGHRFSAPVYARMPLDTWLAFYVASWLMSLSPGAGAFLATFRREVDRMLYEDAGYLPSDFHVGICRKR